jgi:hypothetical protein
MLSFILLANGALLHIMLHVVLHHWPRKENLYALVCSQETGVSSNSAAVQGEKNSLMSFFVIAQPESALITNQAIL